MQPKQNAMREFAEKPKNLLRLQKRNDHTLAFRLQPSKRTVTFLEKERIRTLTIVWQICIRMQLVRKQSPTTIAFSSPKKDRREV